MGRCTNARLSAFLLRLNNMDVSWEMSFEAVGTVCLIDARASPIGRFLLDWCDVAVEGGCSRFQSDWLVQSACQPCPEVISISRRIQFEVFSRS